AAVPGTGARAEISAAATETAASAEEVVSSAEQVNQNVATVRAAAVGLTDMAARLSDLVARFRLPSAGYGGARGRGRPADPGCTEAHPVFPARGGTSIWA